MTTEIAISLPSKDQAIQVYAAEFGLDPYLSQIKAEIDAFQADATTKKGRDAIASMAHKVARSKTALDNLGKELVADLKDVPKKIDAERKRMRDLLDAWKDDVRAPLTAWEQAEADRKEKHQAVIEWIETRIVDAQAYCATEIRTELEALRDTPINSLLEEFEAQAHRAKEQAIKNLTALAEVKEKAEAEAAELAKLRAEAEAREQADRDARLQAEAAAKAKAEAEAQAERREMELKLAAAKAEREKAEAELRATQAKERAESDARAAVERERQRVDAQAKAEAAEADARAKDKAHRQLIHRAALDALEKNNVDAEVAKAVITLIAKGAVPNVVIQY